MNKERIILFNLKLLAKELTYVLDNILFDLWLLVLKVRHSNQEKQFILVYITWSENM